VTRTLFLLWLLQRTSNRCYLCHKVALRDAIYSDICLRHQLLISLRLCWLTIRRRGTRGLGRLLRWWQ
jgi:hypothetical protein